MNFFMIIYNTEDEQYTDCLFIFNVTAIKMPQLFILIVLSLLEVTWTANALQKLPFQRKLESFWNEKQKKLHL